MKIKELVLIIGIILFFPIVSFGSFSLLFNGRGNKSIKHIDKVNIQEVIANNFVSGKEAALLNAQRFLDYKGYNKAMLEEDLKALGYSQKEIKYAIKSVQGL